MEVVTSSLQKRETNLRIISKSSVKKQQIISSVRAEKRFVVLPMLYLREKIIYFLMAMRCFQNSNVFSEKKLCCVLSR